MRTPIAKTTETSTEVSDDSDDSVTGESETSDDALALEALPE